MNLLDFILNVLVLGRIPILNNHTLNWISLLILSWLVADKLKVQTKNKLLNVGIRLTTALAALMFLAGLGEITFDPFWIIGGHLSLQVYFWNMYLANFFYTSLLFGVIFFKLKRVWLISLPLLVGLLWFIGGLHTPAGLYPGDIGYYQDFTANLLDILQQTMAFIAGYFMISGLRLLPIMENLGMKK
jgi:hypothetical protein